MKKIISVMLILVVSLLFVSNVIAKTCPKDGYCNIMKKECLSGQCVAYCKAKTGFSGKVGSAINWPTNSKKPAEGEVVVLKIGPVGHVAYIESVDKKEKTFKVSQYNFSNKYKCKECNWTENYGKVTTSTYNFSDSRIKGYWKK